MYAAYHPSATRMVYHVCLCVCVCLCIRTCMLVRTILLLPAWWGVESTGYWM